MTVNQELYDISQVVARRQLGKALTQLENYLLTRQQPRDAERLQAIKADYQLMADYWKQGYPDPDREAVYDRLLQRLDQLVTNMLTRSYIGSMPYLANISATCRGHRQDWSMGTLRSELESYVSEVAMLELEPPHTRGAKSSSLHKAHQQLMCDLFDYILTSSQWSERVGEAFREMLLSPTVDSRDQQLLVSAVTLSAMNAFDICKFRLLTDIYRQAADEAVRQRAFVGWVLAVKGEKAGLYPEERRLVAELTADEQCRRELKELQMQLVYCVNAEEDTRKIQHEIMPDLLKNSNFRITRNGLVEKEEDPLDDILHPEASEQAMEKVEASFRKMIDMQKQGSDIYFGGFSQMKRYPFFSYVSNWFVPFYADHPALSSVASKVGDNKFLLQMMQQGPFCNSDKYSFFIAFEQVVDRLPQHLRDMMNRGEAVMGNEVLMEERQSAVYIRRIYLQDLYRFFRLHPQRSLFVNPFDDVAFLADPLFRESPMVPLLTDVAVFMLRQKRHDDACRIMGVPLLECYRLIATRHPDSERALLDYARALFAEGRFQEAARAYDQLLDLHPSKKSYLLNKAVCLLRLNDYAAAQSLLYQLNYNYPDDANVSRVLAWSLVCDGKLQKADAIYSQLLTADPAQPDDLLNYGYCLWFSRQVDSAVSMFRQYLKEQTDDSFSMEQELTVTGRELLARQGIGESEIQLMLDALSQNG